MPAKLKIQSLADQLTAAQAELAAQVSALASIAEGERDALSSDEAYTGWTRRKRVAETERERLTALIASIEVKIEDERQAVDLAEYDQRYKEGVARAERVETMFREDLVKAWDIIACVMREAALARIEVDAIRRDRPAGYRPDKALYDPDHRVRTRPALSEEIIDCRIDELWVERETGHLFANQSEASKKSARKKKFRITKYLPHRKGDTAPPFWETLRFPRLGSSGNVIMFDGSKMGSPSAVLEWLDRPATAVKETERYELTKIESVDQTSDGQPGLSGSHFVTNYEKELDARYKELDMRRNPPKQTIGSQATSSRAVPRAAAPTDLVDIGPDRSARRADRSVEKESPSLIGLVEDQIGSSLKPYRDGLKDNLT